MRILKRIAPAALILALVVGLALVRADDPPKYTVKQVMDMANKDSKDKTVLSIYSKLLGQHRRRRAEESSAASWSTCTRSWARTSRPKGDADDWTKRVTIVVADAKDVADGKDGSIAQLKKDNDCMGCHKEHRVFKP